MRESDCVPIEVRIEPQLEATEAPWRSITTATEMDIERLGADDDAYGLVCSADDFRRRVFVSFLRNDMMFNTVPWVYETRNSIEN